MCGEGRCGCAQLEPNYPGKNKRHLICKWEDKCIYQETLFICMLEFGGIHRWKLLSEMFLFTIMDISPTSPTAILTSFWRNLLSVKPPLWWTRTYCMCSRFTNYSRGKSFKSFQNPSKYLIMFVWFLSEMKDYFMFFF